MSRNKTNKLSDSIKDSDFAQKDIKINEMGRQITPQPTIEI